MRWAGHVARIGDVRRLYRILVGKLEGKRPLGRPTRRWENNINESSGSGMWEYGLDRVSRGQGKVAGTCDCGSEPLGSIKCGEFLD